MKLLIQAIGLCAMALIPSLTFAQASTVTAGKYAPCGVSWQMTLDAHIPLPNKLAQPMWLSPWGTVLTKENSAGEWEGTASPTGGLLSGGSWFGQVIIKPVYKGIGINGWEGDYYFNMCQRVTPSADETKTSYILASKGTSRDAVIGTLNRGLWYLEPGESYETTIKGNELKLKALFLSLSGGLIVPVNGMAIRILPSHTQKVHSSAFRPGRMLGPIEFRYVIVATCKEDRCLTPDGKPFNDEKLR
jgi:hypothetical protein